ncbi:Uncharacterized protein Fot_13509 [Forsythia ovata]|uniref:Uncharacterized protein n=1 Tax=Forsythia ovata TaxID=205694 RepID=A0ABD1W3N7_9LAMI
MALLSSTSRNNQALWTVGKIGDEALDFSGKTETISLCQISIISTNRYCLGYDLHQPIEISYQYIQSGVFEQLCLRVISVEYTIRDDNDRRNGHSPDRRGRDVSSNRRSYGVGRSPSPYRNSMSSPDYGHGSVQDSRSNDRITVHRPLVKDFDLEKDANARLLRKCL